MKLAVVFLALFASALALDYVKPTQVNIFGEEKLQKLLSLPQPLSRNLADPVYPLSFDWKNCNGGADSPSLVLNNLTIIPDPIRLGANATFHVSLTVKHPLDNDALHAVELKLSKKVFGLWVEIPCVDNVGSCRYESLCDMLNKISDTLCPILNPYKLPCKCPIPSGTYSVGPQTLFIKDPGLSWLANGDYQVQAQFIRKDGSKMGCIQVVLSLEGSH